MKKFLKAADDAEYVELTVVVPEEADTSALPPSVRFHFSK
jgi:hypothetical protein